MRQLDIVIPQTHLDELTKKLVDLGVRGYTVLGVNSGRGPRGGQALNLAFDQSAAAYVIVTASDDVAERAWTELGDFVRHNRGHASMTEVLKAMP